MSGEESLRGPVQKRQSAFDLTRFLCATLVVVGHGWTLTGVHLSLPHTMLSVDAFFMISGFVLQKHFASKYAAGAYASDLIFTRLVRIIPTAYVALTLGLVEIFVTSLHPDLGRLLAQWVAGVLMLPTIGHTGTNPIAPLDFPFWTLIWEVWINVAFIAFWRRIRPLLLAGMILAAGVTTLLMARSIGSLNFGADVQDVFGGAARAIFAFFIGVGLAKFVDTRWTAPAAPAWAVVVALIAVFAVPAPAGLRWLYEVGAVAVALPLIVWFGAAAKSPVWLAGMAAVLGDLYYGVYAFHEPVLRAFSTIRDMCGWNRSAWLLAPAMAVILALGFVVSRVIDPWARRKARALWTRRRQSGSNRSYEAIMMRPTPGENRPA